MSSSGNIMNCDDYKQAIAADPSESFADGAEHVAACESCAEFKAEMLALDESIAKALSFDVPELHMPELPPLDGEDENVVNMPFKRKARITMPSWIGIAAGFALAAFLGVLAIIRRPLSTLGAGVNHYSSLLKPEGRIGDVKRLLRKWLLLSGIPSIVLGIAVVAFNGVVSEFLHLERSAPVIIAGAVLPALFMVPVLG